MILALVVWLGLKLDADGSSASSLDSGRAPAGEIAIPAPGAGETSGAAPAPGYAEPEELTGFGGEGILPALLDALDDVDCDFDDPFSNCQ